MAGIRYAYENGDFDYRTSPSIRLLLSELDQLTFAAAELCNAHKWSYGGPETLRALSARLREAANN